MNTEAKKNRKITTSIILVGIVAPLVLAILVGVSVIDNAHDATFQKINHSIF